MRKRRRSRWLCAVAIGAVTIGAAWAAPASAASTPITLAQAQRMALQQHPSLRVAKFDEEVAREAIRIARSGYSPQVEGVAVSALAKPETRVAANLAGIGDPTIIQRTAAGVAVSQYITDFGHTADLVQSYQFAAHAADERGRQTQLQVLLGVTEAYFEVLRARSLVRVANQTYDERETLLRRTSVLQKAGLLSTLDVSIARRDASSASQMILAAKATLRDALATFSETLGSPVERDYDFADVRSLPEIPRSVGPLIDEMLAANPELLAMTADVAAAQKRASAVARETSPTIMAYGYFGGTPIRAANQAINAAYATAGVALDVPILNGGELAAARRQSEDQAELAAGQLEVERNSLLRDARVAFDDVQSARGNIDATEQTLKTARTAYALTNARYRIGLSSIVDLSQAELAVTQAQIDHTNAIYDYVEQGAGLEFVTGVLEPGS